MMRRTSLTMMGLLLGLALGASLVPGASALRYDDVAAAEHVDFRRAGDPFGSDTNFVELMGGGACWLDYDHDGELDAFFVSGWYNSSALAAAAHPHSRLFRNLGPGLGFVDATASAGLDVTGWTQACSAADYDGDGWTDLLVVGYGIQSMFHNDGGAFSNVTAGSGISAIGKCPVLPCWGTGAAWADYDRDGCLDVYVINFVRFDLYKGGTRGPGPYHGQPGQLYHNNCDGTFADVTAAAGADGAPSPNHSKSWATTWLDYDRDGWLDIYITSDGTPNTLYRNNHDGTFTDVAPAAGVDDTRNGMGLATGDCNEDGYEDLYFTHYQGSPPIEYIATDGFYVNRGNGTFADHSGEGDLAVAIPYVKWGVGMEDLDNDGNLDVHVATGHTEPLSGDGVVQSGVDEPPLLWRGDGACHWTDIRASAGPGMQLKRDSRGTAYADYDHDGVLDIAQVDLVEEPSLLLRGSDVAGHWLTIELRQPGKNGQAMGADVNVTLPGGRVLHWRMNPFQSIHGNNAPQVHVGLGDALTANVTVRWPEDLAETTYAGLPADRIVRLFRDGHVQQDTLAPRTRLLIDGEAQSPRWARTPRDLSLVASDAAAGSASASGVAHTFLTLDGTVLADPAPLVLGEGWHTLRVHSEDAAGNVEPARTFQAGVDSVPPALGITLEGTLVGDWYQGPVHVTLPCIDATSGVAEVAWHLDDEPWTSGSSIDLTRPGAHTLHATCTDAAGNVAEASQDLRIDLGHPETLPRITGTPGLAGWWRSDVTVALDAAGGQHGVVAIHVQVDGSQPRAYQGPFPVDGDGAHTLVFWADDDAGNVEPARTEQVRIDSTPPALWAHALSKHVDRDGTIFVGLNHQVAFGATDAGSGVGVVEARREGDAFSVQPGTMRWIGEGAHTLGVLATDAAGNVAQGDFAIYLDLTAPPLGIARPVEQGVEAGDVAVQLPLRLLSSRALVALDAPIEADVGFDMSGAARVDFLVDGQWVAATQQAPWVWRWSLPPDAQHTTHTVTLRVEDAVGNWRRTSFTVTALGQPALPSPIAQGPGFQDGLALLLPTLALGLVRVRRC